jgi:hypothetical protein
MIKNVVRSTQVRTLNLGIVRRTCLSKRDKTSTEFSTLVVGVNVYPMQYTPNNKTTQLKVENSVQTAFRFSPVSFHAIANETVQK